MVSRTIIIGDIHGCLEEFEELLRLVEYRSNDQLILAGDLVAKGPDSRGVVAKAHELGALGVRGNHDEHVLKFLRGVPLRPGHLAVANSLTEKEWSYLSALPLYVRLPQYRTIVVHAGLVPGRSLSEQRPLDLLNMRSIDAEGQASKRVEGGVPWASRWPGPELVVFGHDAVRGLQMYPNAIGLDTGCCYGRQLTALVFPEKRIVSVQAKRVYRSVGDDTTGSYPGLPPPER